MPFAPTDIVIKSPKTAARLFEGRMVVITVADSMLHRLDEVGTFIWHLLEKKIPVYEICQLIQDHFEGFDAAQRSSEIMQFLETLEKKSLVVRTPAD